MVEKWCFLFQTFFSFKFDFAAQISLILEQTQDTTIMSFHFSCFFKGLRVDGNLNASPDFVTLAWCCYLQYDERNKN